MKLTCKPGDLKSALQKLQHIPGTKNAGPTTQSVIVEASAFEGLFLRRYTPEAVMQVVCEAEVEEDGICAVNSDSLSAFCAGSIDVELMIEKGKLNLRCGTRKASLPRNPDAEQYKDEFKIEGRAITGMTSDWSRWLKIAEKGQYLGEGRDYCRGVCVRTMDGRLVFIGVDNRRMCLAYGGEELEPVLENDKGFDAGVLIPKPAQAAILSMIGDSTANLTVTLNQRGMIFAGGSEFVKFSITDVAPPDVSVQVSGMKSDSMRTIPREPLIELIRSALPFGEGDTHTLSMNYAPNEVQISGLSEWSDSIPAEIVSSPLKFRLNGQYFLDMLTCATGDQIELEYVEKYSCLVIREPDRFLMLSLIRDGK